MHIIQLSFSGKENKKQLMNFEGNPDAQGQKPCSAAQCNKHETI